MTRHNLYMFRCDKKLKQSEIAEKIGVSRATYSFVERGIRSGTQDFWNGLQKAFDIPDSEMWKLQKIEERADQWETKEK